MSRINGDKARFHRVRKQRLARRVRQRGLFKTVAAQSSAAPTRPDVKSKERPA